jgi:hypothetical protein
MWTILSAVPYSGNEMCVANYHSQIYQKVWLANDAENKTNKSCHRQYRPALALTAPLSTGIRVTILYWL